MDRLFTTASRQHTLMSTHKVLRNTYFLLSLTLAFSALVATASAVFRLPSPGILLTFVGFYGLLFLTYRLANRLSGIFSTFALTGFMGYTLGPLLNFLFSSGSRSVVSLALGGTALVFFLCSAYVLKTKKEMSFISGILVAGFVSLLVAVFANLFLQIPALSLTISTMFVLFSSGGILLETSNIIHGGETNYIRATVSLYVSIYNIFVSFLNIFTGIRKN